MESFRVLVILFYRLLRLYIQMQYQSESICFLINIILASKIAYELSERSKECIQVKEKSIKLPHCQDSFKKAKQHISIKMPFTCCSCSRKISNIFILIHTIAETFHTDVAVMSIQCIQTSKVRSAFNMVQGNIYTI